VFSFVCDEADSSIFVFGKQPDRRGSVSGHQYGDHLVSMTAVDAEVFIQLKT